MSVVPADEETASATDDPEAPLAPSTTLGHSPISSIIRPQLWVHWMITAFCLLAWGGMLYLGDLAEQHDVGLRDIVGLRSGRLTDFFSTVMLLWAGQLALLIYWYRRKSRNDFAGRYRMWLWIGGILQLFLAVVATGAHRPFSEYMQRVWPLNIPGYGLYSWLVPVATLSLGMYRILRIELKRHRSGKLLLGLAGFAGVTSAGSLIFGPFLPERSRDLIQIGSATLAQLGLATALLMHARYVVHVCNEAPRKEKRTRRILMAARNAVGYLPLPKRPNIKLPRLQLPALSLLKVRLPKPTLPKLSERKRLQSEVKMQEPAKPAPEKPLKRNVVEQPRPKSPESDSSQAAVETRAVISSKKQRRKQRQAAQRVDAPQQPKGPRRAPQRSLDDVLNEYGDDAQIDPDVISGLSKKQRRRLRKKQRELQRAGH